MRERRLGLLLGACVLVMVGALLPLPSDAHAQKTPTPKQAASQPAGAVDAEVMLLHATNRPDGGTGIDPRIGNLPALKQPPFSSYNTYTLISKNKYPVTKQAPATTTLPNGRVLQVSLREVLAASRYRIAASINQPGGTTFMPLLEVTTPAGEPFFVAGQSYQGGVLVIGITVLK
jgi:hypothetical protein